MSGQDELLTRTDLADSRPHLSGPPLLPGGAGAREPDSRWRDSDRVKAPDGARALRPFRRLAIGSPPSAEAPRGDGAGSSATGRRLVRRAERPSDVAVARLARLLRGRGHTPRTRGR